ncbi:cytochrome P450 family protein [Nocardia brasiliensis]|uniref:cytochrome P450 family protein n=1 Tax=Nocardia brasiliensis TaxID=37326 RepID=UPI0004A71EDD|nr:cytochrome P450 [Nocardia brasiliensis]MBF6544926.1 cytochrome P450 [Nocardia brasiliensis]
MTKPLIRLGTEFLYNPYPVYDELRAQGPVHHVLLPNGLSTWLVVDYQLGRAVLADDRVRKDAASIAPITTRLRGEHDGMTAVSTDLWKHMLSSDPPDHTRLRRLVSKAFTARTVDQLHPRIETLADELLDRMAGAPEVDLIEGYALPIPITVICELFGVPEADRNRFRELSTTMTATSAENVEDPDAADSPFYATAAQRAAASVELATYLIGLIAERTENLGEDLLSQLILANHEGDKLSDQELIAMLFLILVAGHETTVNLIGNGLLALLRDRALYTELTAEPERIPAAIEEFLRYEGPVHVSTLRYTAEPITLAGIDIPADELISVSLLAANHDPGRFTHPDRIRIGQAAKGGHLAFGHGIHYCVGAPLARLEARLAFEKILARYPDMRLAEAVRWRPSSTFRGVQSLPVVLE